MRPVPPHCGQGFGGLPMVPLPLHRGQRLLNFAIIFRILSGLRRLSRFIESLLLLELLLV
jgi:hypothetical protein